MLGCFLSQLNVHARLCQVILIFYNLCVKVDDVYLYKIMFI